MPLRNPTLACILLVATAAAPAANLYQVEMLIFQRADDARGESFAPLPKTPPFPTASADLESRAVSHGGGRLGPDAYTLERKGYRTLYHLAWRQAASGLSSDTWYGLSGPGVEGRFRLRRGRYLHVDTDLQLAGGVRARGERRMRSRETHYIDHPRVGILIRIDPLASAAASAAPTTADGESPPDEPAQE